LAVAKELEKGFGDDKRSCNDQFSEIVREKTGIAVSTTDDVFKCLVKKAKETRDDPPNEWHNLHLEKFATYDDDCKSVTYAPAALKGHGSVEVISDKVVTDCKKR
jgi:hypothetical protein